MPRKPKPRETRELVVIDGELKVRITEITPLVLVEESE